MPQEKKKTWSKPAIVRLSVPDNLDVFDASGPLTREQWEAVRALVAKAKVRIERAG